MPNIMKNSNRVDKRLNWMISEKNAKKKNTRRHFWEISVKFINGFLS